MRKREVLDRSTTPDGTPLELAIEGGHHTIRVGNTILMSSAASGSEEHMAVIAREMLGERRAPRILVGGLGMGGTLRAVLENFGSDAKVTVAELLPALIRYARTFLAELAGHALADPRVELYEGDVCDAIARARWDAILLDVDNGPSALTAASNASLYNAKGTARLHRALTADGVLVVWSVTGDTRYEARLRAGGFDTKTVRVRARSNNKGTKHTLFVGRKH
jgi:spermidine synthase